MPHLSLYQPTHRSVPEKLQDPIRFRNLVKSLDSQLRKTADARDADELLAPFYALADDHEFWVHSADGLAVLAAPGIFETHRLQRTVPELTIVADSFHTKPLLRVLQSADRYQILGVSRQEIHLYEGNRDEVGEIPLAPGVPRTISDALGDQLTEPHLTFGTYGTGNVGPAMHHGHGSKKDEVDIDAERFFRVIDRAILDHHSKPSRLPLLLAALPEHHNLFRALSHNPQLMEEGLDFNPASVSLDELRRRAWKVVEPRYRERLAQFIEAFSEASAKQRGSADISDVAMAALGGRVDTLLVDADRVVPGRFDRETGTVTFADGDGAAVDDLLDDIAELVLGNKGEVVVVPGDTMPTATGLAAIYRF